MEKTKDDGKFTFDMVHVKLDLTKRYMSEEAIRDGESAVRICGDIINEMDRECVAVINLTAAGKPINFSIVSMGLINASLVCAREVFKSAILANATSIIMLHNHPSGSIEPSKEDIRATEMMCAAGVILGIPVLDHLIVVPEKKEWTSMASKGYLNKLSFKEAEIKAGITSVAEDQMNLNLEQCTLFSAKKDSIEL